MFYNVVPFIWYWTSTYVSHCSIVKYPWNIVIKPHEFTLNLSQTHRGSISFKFNKKWNPKKFSFQKTFSSCNHILPNQILFSEKTMNHFHCSNTFVYSSRLPHVGNPFVFEWNPKLHTVSIPRIKIFKVLYSLCNCSNANST